MVQSHPSLLIWHGSLTHSPHAIPRYAPEISKIAGHGLIRDPETEPLGRILRLIGRCHEQHVLKEWRQGPLVVLTRQVGDSG